MAEAFLGYHITRDYGKFSGEKFSTTTKIPNGSVIFVVSNSNKKKSEEAIYCLEGKYQVESSANSDNKNIHKLKLLASTSILLNLDSMQEFDKKTFHNHFTSNNATKKIIGSQEYLIKLFDSLLVTENKAFDLSLIADLSNIDIDTDNLELSDTERLELKLARIGQGEFRKNTIKFWGGDEKCAVTGLRIPALLNASHITPWKECKSTPSERKNGSNGVMLCVHLDRLFDRFLIGFQKTNKPDVRSLVYSPKIKDSFSSLKEIGIDKTLVLDLKMVKFVEKHLLEQNLDKHLARVLEEL